MKETIEQQKELLQVMGDFVPLAWPRKECDPMDQMYRPRRCTWEEFEALPPQEGINYELIDGILYMSPRPAVRHQLISGNLYYELRNVLAGKPCQLIYEIDLVLEKNNLVPDLMIACGEGFSGKRHEKPPLIAIEILSPSSASRDCVVKLNKYRELGVTEYWVVSPEEGCIDVFSFAENRHEHFRQGKVRSAVLPEVAIDLEKIFA